MSDTGSTPWLIDQSALARLNKSSRPDLWAARVDRGLVRVSTVTLLEAGYSARSASDMQRLFRHSAVAAMPVEYLTPVIEDRAVEILGLLAERGKHRAPSIPDVLVAATAEVAGLTVLHVDKDFELIAEITHQALERLPLAAE